MNASRACFLFTLFLAGAAIAASAAGPGRYLGLTPPSAPEPFEPPLLAGAGTRALVGIAFTSDLRRAVLTLIDAGADGKVAPGIHETRLAGGEWSAPAPVPSLGGLPGGEAAFSRDGRWLYFSSDRPPGAPARPRAFRAAIRDGQVGPPEPLPLQVAADAGVYYPRPLANGDLLFTSRGPVGRDDLFIARARGAAFDTPEPVGGDFNSAKDDWDLVESRDGRLRVWVSAREGSLGRTDLFFSRREGAAWSPPRNLSAVNSTALETAPALSPDGRVLFFLRRVDGRERMYWTTLTEEMLR